MKALVDMSNFKRAVNIKQNNTVLDLFIAQNTNSFNFIVGHNKWRKHIENKIFSSAKSKKENRKKTNLIENIHVDNIVKKSKEFLNGL